MKTSSYRRIQQLSSQLANQIAAGEVVERPASVLKELLENSIDAGSQRIDVVLERGGIGLIRVQDDGIGICKEDLELAIAAHATSKIQSLEDLEGVNSYGFRGEALASISAVSHLKIASCVASQEFSWCLEMKGRNTHPTISPIPKRQGTLIEVRDLFYNTPARRKFLRSEKTELAHLEEIFKRIALSQPHITFSLFQGDRLQKRLTAARSQEAEARRVALLCGDKFMQEAYYIEAEANGLKLSGWIGSKKAQRSQADLQYFYVNGRVVRDKVVSHAVRQAYQDFCVPGRFPAYLLYFDLDPKSVDVNVHPTKHEVRFREARTVHAFLTYSIREGLEKTENITNKTSQGFLDQEFMKEPMTDPKITKILAGPEPCLAPKTSLGKPLSIWKNEFLLAESEEELVVVDVKMVRQMLAEKKLREAYHSGAILSRPVLMPKLIDVGTCLNSMNIMESLLEELKKLGLELTLSGPTTVLVRSVPSLFGESSSYLESLIKDLLKHAKSAIEEKIILIAKFVSESQACSLIEGEALLTELQNLTVKGEIEERKLYRKITLEQLRAALF